MFEDWELVYIDASLFFVQMSCLGTIVSQRLDG